MNHVTPDGLLAVEQCKRTIRFRSEAIILQDSCEPEPRLDLTMRAMSSCGKEQLDVAQITQLRDALNEWLLDHKPARSGWMHNGITYDMDAAWWGRPDTPYHGLMYRHTGKWRDGIPMMRIVDQPEEYNPPVPLTRVLGL